MKNIRKNLKLKKQKGATAVEFAFVFPILFMLLYGTVTYGYVFFLYQTLQYAVQQGAESAMSVDPASTSYQTTATSLAQGTINQDLTVLSTIQKSRLSSTVSFTTLAGDNAPTLQVAINYNLTGLFPSITLPFVNASFPPLPATLNVQAIARPGVGI